MLGTCLQYLLPKPVIPSRVRSLVTFIAMTRVYEVLRSVYTEPVSFVSHLKCSFLHIERTKTIASRHSIDRVAMLIP
jgi:hypothetical protein